MVAARRGMGGKRINTAALLQAAVHVAALIPLMMLIWDGVHGNLTANPIQEITARTGKTALVLLVLSLACTPASSIFGLRMALRWRRPLGVYAFLYAALHFLTFSVLDYGLDPVLLRGAIFEKRYALVGFAAFALLIPLAITSTHGWMRRLGKRWRKLHRLVYPAALLVIVHYVWLVKSDIRVPLAYGAVVLALLALRLRPVKDFVGRLRTKIQRSLRSRATGDAGQAVGQAGTRSE